MTEKKDVVETAIEKAKPILMNVSFGGIMGYCSGVALHKIGKSIAVIIGGGFVALQLAASLGYIDVKWENIQKSASEKIDVDKDGKVTAEDVKEYWKILKKVLTYELPSAGGFSLGFLYGVRYG
jgi:FUN14 domain-containing protein 1